MAGSGKKIILIAVIAVLVLVIIGLVAVLVRQLAGREKDVPAAGFSLDTHTIVEFTIDGGPFSNVNLEQVEGEAKYFATIHITLGIYRERTVNSRELEEYTEFLSKLRSTNSLIRSAVIEVLRSASFDDLEGGGGQDFLGEMILKKLREVYGTDRIGRVYFQQFQLT